jgi:hypothetical protein
VTGIIQTVAGSSASSPLGDGGPATAAALGIPRDVDADAAGNLSGDGGEAAIAQLSNPTDLVIAPDDRILIADRSNHRIRAVVAGNTPPVADAGGAQTVEQTGATTPVTLDGSGSTDADGDVLTYDWRDGNNVSVGNTATVALQLAAGTYAFSLTVSDGNSSSTSTTTVTVADTIPPSLAIQSPVNGGAYTLNQQTPANYSCSDAGSGVASCTGQVPNGSPFSTSTPGVSTFAVQATDASGNVASASSAYQVLYSAGSCLGAPGHAVLAPVNADGTSVFKRNSTVPVKFRVCDAAGASVGSPGVVASFALVQILVGTVSSAVNEAVESSTPDAAFRWDPSAQQWIFNISTKNLTANRTYVYAIGLNDGTAIQFQYGLR